MGRELGMTANGCEDSFWHHKTVLKLVVMVVQFYKLKTIEWYTLKCWFLYVDYIPIKKENQPHHISSCV